MQLVALILFIATLALPTGLLGLSRPALAMEPLTGQPDIIVLYLDDVDPHDGRLWNDPARTPTLASLFSERGVAFSQAVAETPLCSPGRASTLTGQHTLNHGVQGNVAAPFDPGVSIATELGDVGYRTLFVGKYLNDLRSGMPLRAVDRHAAPWDAFDVIYEDNGQYFDYDMWTHEGLVHYESGDTDGSTQVTKRRLVRHLRDSPPDEPVLAFASVFDLHAPNRPVQRHRGNDRCADIEDWKPPNFGADVSGKPAYVRERRPLGKDGWPMRRYCEQMLGVDELAEALMREQQRRGRLDDTLFVLTADNGVTWGTQRLQQRKGVPYATPIPLILSWPARWGDEPVLIDELVSNIDLAPTLCAVAGCQMGPFKDGQTGPDGVDLLPLMDGQVDHLDRLLVREQSGPLYPWAPEFWALRTSSQHPLGRWHYIEYETGEVELYDSAADPWELENLAASPEHAAVEVRLAAALRSEFGDDLVTAGRTAPG